MDIISRNVFYITFPFIVSMLIKIGVHRNIFKSLLVTFVIWLFLFRLNMILDENNSVHVWALHIFPLIRLFEFVVGIILGLIFVSQRAKVNLTKHLFSTLELFCVLCFVCLLLISTNMDVGLVRGGLFIPIWCILIFLFSFQGGIISEILSHKMLVYLGEISFSFYMIHQLVIRYLDIFKLGNTLNIIISFLTSIILAIIIYHFYEEPVRKKLRLKFQRPTKSTDQLLERTVSEKKVL